MMSARKAQSGMTLVELMIAVVIVGIVIAAALAMGFAMINSYRDHRAMVLVERSARVSLEIIADAVRGSAPGVPQLRVEDLVGCQGPLGLRTTNSSADPDSLELVYASTGQRPTALRQPYTDTSTVMTVANATNIKAGDYVVVTNISDGAAVIQVTDVTPNGPDFDLTTASPSGKCGAGITSGAFPDIGFPQGSLVMRAKLARFYVLDDASVANLPTLMLDPDGDPDTDNSEPLAQGIEDMQIAIGIDTDGDGAVTENGAAAGDDEWFYNVAGEPDPDPALLWRAVRITLVARSLREQSDVSSYTRPGTEDRAEAATPDPFRRRILKTTVEIRNMKDSP